MSTDKEKQKEKIKINVAFFNYSNKDTDTIEVRSDQTFLDVILENKIIRVRLIALAFTVFILYLII